ncbi:4-amino-4-deoxy-L-arabinose transferase-like glycosyltransferase [Arthrobacter pigmenti]|uniref:4-amino-4-deoxy-L-arabinose transferase-like glycosyltransferase n=1 Tax=Arthrobacter pigmenti TaxID=271432 RepID=A0A846RLE6_9MICC|nr:glycosyltransferase family 39 protein [Arthrobacter pigmenti]NJC21104.1 4-amino-4-deoxy-L-arabinose transferase-like glycosyltransferase [Arthrobacter pigmenti]
MDGTHTPLRPAQEHRRRTDVPVFLAMGTLALVLTVTSWEYGYHRDELYFRMLEPAWGYVDQPPFTPLVVQFLSGIVDEVWFIRIPATLAAAASVLVVALITRELGGGKNAQTLCAWAFAFASMPLLMGHVMLTASFDLFMWPAVCLLILRAILRGEDRWWFAAGILVGLSMYNKLLIAGLLISLALGLLVAGPRRMLWSKGALGAAVVALVIGSPNLIYQAVNDWPQLAMGAALTENNAGEVRVLMWPFLFLLLGPPLVPVWVAGLVALFRRPQWRKARFLAAAFPFLLVFAFAAGGQIYYPYGLLAVLFAAGCVPVAEFFRGRPGWRAWAVAAVVVNSVVSAVIALPLLPVSVLGNSPVPDINQLAADQVGWHTYVERIAEVYGQQPEAAVIITSNYGEAGAMARYGPELGLPMPYSGHNQLYFEGVPPDGTTTAVIVGGQIRTVAQQFELCETAATLDNGVGVDNEEQGQPITVCTGPLAPWSELWPAFRHFD